MVHAFVDCQRYGYLINKSLPFKIMYPSIHRFFSVLENKKNNKVKLHSIKSYKVMKIYKFNLMQFLFSKKKNKKKNGGVNMLLPEIIFSQLVLE